MLRPEPLFLPTVSFLISVAHARLPASFFKSGRRSLLGSTSPVRRLCLSVRLELASWGMAFLFESRQVFRPARGWETDLKSVSRERGSIATPTLDGKPFG